MYPTLLKFCNFYTYSQSNRLPKFNEFVTLYFYLFLMSFYFFRRSPLLPYSNLVDFTRWHIHTLESAEIASKVYPDWSLFREQPNIHPWQRWRFVFSTTPFLFNFLIFYKTKTYVLTSGILCALTQHINSLEAPNKRTTDNKCWELLILLLRKGTAKKLFCKSGNFQFFAFHKVNILLQINFNRLPCD